MQVLSTFTSHKGSLCRHSSLRFALFLLIIASSGCAFKNTPVPLGDSELVGYWVHESEEVVGEGVRLTRMVFDISQDGYVSYHFMSCFSEGEDVTKSKLLHLYSMPIIRVTTKKIKAQTFPLTPKWEFQIHQWPSREGDNWTMKVDKLLLKKVADGVDVKAWACS